MSALSSQRRLLIATAIATATAVALAGCGPKKAAFIGSDITGTKLGQDMAMVDGNGDQRSLADYKGKVVVVFFGFTHCPDVCPTAMTELAQAMELLGKDAAQVQVLMISVEYPPASAALMASM